MSKKLKGTPDRVWLAGLGALSVAEQEGNDLFQQLVKKGREVEKTLDAPGADIEIEVIGGLERSNRGPGKVRTFRSFLRSSLSRYRKAYPLNSSQKEAPKLKKSEDLSLLQFLPDSNEEGKFKARQARRLDAARRAFLKEFGGLEKPTVDWERLQREHKIFTVTHRGVTYVPSFQFDDKGKPRPAVAKVIRILGKDTSDWGLALWFTSASGRLDGKRPVDLLSSYPKEVVQAAEQEAAELVF